MKINVIKSKAKMVEAIFHRIISFSTLNMSILSIEQIPLQSTASDVIIIFFLTNLIIYYKRNFLS